MTPFASPRPRQGDSTCKALILPSTPRKPQATICLVPAALMSEQSSEAVGFIDTATPGSFANVDTVRRISHLCRTSSNASGGTGPNSKPVGKSGFSATGPVTCSRLDEEGRGAGEKGKIHFCQGTEHHSNHPAEASSGTSDECTAPTRRIRRSSPFKYAGHGEGRNGGEERAQMRLGHVHRLPLLLVLDSPFMGERTVLNVCMMIDLLLLVAVTQLHPSMTLCGAHGGKFEGRKDPAFRLGHPAPIDESDDERVRRLRLLSDMVSLHLGLRCRSPVGWKQWSGRRERSEEGAMRGAVTELNAAQQGQRVRQEGM